MSYERLNITDGIDKWDVAKVRHLEDAIIAAEKQADWNQADSSSVDYIKNKTHGTEIVDAVLVDSQDVAFEWYEGSWIIENYWEDYYITPPDSPFQEGDTLILTVDGVDYESAITIRDDSNDEQTKYSVSFTDYSVILPWWCEDGYWDEDICICPKAEVEEDTESYSVDMKLSVRSSAGEITVIQDTVSAWFEAYYDEYDDSYWESIHLDCDDGYQFEQGDVVTLVVDGVESEHKINLNSTSTYKSYRFYDEYRDWTVQLPTFYISSGTFSNQLSISTDDCGEVSVTEDTMNISIYYRKTNIKQLDEKYIPDTIARTSDIDITDAQAEELLSRLEGYIKEEEVDD